MELLNGPLSCQTLWKHLGPHDFYQCLFVYLQYPQAASWPCLQPPTSDIWALLETQSLPGQWFYIERLELFLLTVPHSCPGLMQANKLSWKLCFPTSRNVDFYVCVPEQLARVVERLPDPAARFCWLHERFRTAGFACQLHAPPSVNTWRLCCLERSMAQLR